MKRKKRWAASWCCLMAAAVLTAGCGSAKKADIEQADWHLLSSVSTPEGVEVEIAGENLLLKKGVRITADSQESEEFAADWAADGISDEDSQRWSSENDWENNEHWLQAAFPEETQIGYVKIFWERTNACAYTLEYSQDGKNWDVAAAFDSAPEQAEQNICLETPVLAKYLRLHVTEVTKEEADLSLYYQNVSVLEMEVYAGVEDRFQIAMPLVEAGTDRKLSLPQVPEGYEIALGGADYENLITAEGEIADTLSDVSVEVGFVLKKEGVSWELPGMEITVSGSQETPAEKSPVSAAEWKSGNGLWQYPDKICLTFLEDEQERISGTAAVFARELTESGLFQEVQIKESEKEAEGSSQSEPGQAVISLTLSEEKNSLGEEGYEILIEEAQVTILANTVQGLRWGCVTLADWMEQEAAESTEGTVCALPQGTLRDYPKYSVRGFGIDVGRRAISMDLLYRIVEELSAHKMNTLQIHLNDNQIIAQSEYDGTVAGARSLYAGFRLESDLKNEEGQGITSQDLFYTKEEFAKLIETAAAYGVEIVPEIDTPAHSLALTKVFPELGFSRDPESVDQLDLSKNQARQLVKEIWAEYLTNDRDASADTDSTEGTDTGSTFEDCTALHLGMDEYYGKDTAYMDYLEELSAYVWELAPGKDLRIWGSLSKMDADNSGVSRNLQMHVWDTDWADPGDMYEEGFSIINSLSSSLYIIPGGGYDRLDLEFLQNEWQPNLFLTAERNWELPAWSERMLGACYMMWNDWSWMNGDQITEESLFERFAEPLPILAEKLW